jgi:hypothetical protein
VRPLLIAAAAAVALTGAAVWVFVSGGRSDRGLAVAPQDGAPEQGSRSNSSEAQTPSTRQDLPPVIAPSVPNAGDREGVGPGAEPRQDPAPAPSGKDLEGARHVLLLHGRVTDEDEKPLAGVEIEVPGRKGLRTTSLADGSYRLEVPVLSTQQDCVVTFRAPELRQAQKRLTGETLDAESVQLDVVLLASDAAVLVSGVLLAPEPGGDFAPAADEILNLHSPSGNRRYVARTAQDGSFEFLGVEPAEDYVLWVYPRGEFQDLRREGLVVPAEGLELDLRLAPLATGGVRGRVLDAVGSPLPGAQLWVRSTQASVRSLAVDADADGRFELDGVPLGELVFETRSGPLLSVNGVRAAAPAGTEIVLRLGVGPHELRGIVRGAQGRVIVGAKVDLSWTTKLATGGRSSAAHTCLTDGQGGFAFAKLPRGLHRLRVTAPGHQPAQLDHVVSANDPTLEIRLELAARE